MTDPTGPVYGLGGNTSPPDDRDWDIATLYAMAGLEELATVPASFRVPGTLPPVLDQGIKPQCVAFSQSSLKAYEDLKDQGPFNFDEGLFFAEIGGNANGAYVRAGLSRMLNYGYPVAGSGQPQLHRIAGYYAVSHTEAAIKSALVSFGIVTVLLNWQEEWFHPGPRGVLPAGRNYAGGHEIDIIGYDEVEGAELQNTWGTAYGVGGRVFLSWPQLTAKLIEAWKTTDQIVKPPSNVKYHLSIAANADLQIATLKGSCIAKWTKRKWGALASGAPCRAPEVRKGCSSGQATVVYVTAGAFAGQRIRITTGTTVTKA
jgi:hypothetical protein